MLGLPKTTEMNRQLPKNIIFDRFKPSAVDRQRFDAEIRRLAIVHEVSAATVNMAAGENVAALYVVLVILRSAECDKKNLAMLSKLIDQNMLFVIEYDGKARLAAYRAGRVIQSDYWKPLDEWTLNLTGLNLDSVWENIIVQIGGITIAEGNTLDAQIVVDEEYKKLLRRIEQLEKQARSEKQPRQKWGLAEEAKRLKKQMEESCNG
jgi:hypothetical protein